MRVKILMIIPNLGFGGAQRVFHDLSLCLSEKHEVVECVFNFEMGHAFPTSNQIVSLDVPAGKTLFAKFFFFIIRVIKLRRIKKKFGIQYSISHLEGADYINILSSIGESKILCIHGSKIYDKKIQGWIGWMRKKVLIKFLYQFATKIIVVAQGIKDELIREFKIRESKLIVINNGFNLKSIAEKSQQQIDSALKAILKEKITLVTHGRLAEEKDQKILLDIMTDDLVRQKFRLIIIGDGPLRELLITHAIEQDLNIYTSWGGEKLNSKNEVIFLGYTPNPFAILSNSDLFLFPSLYEGFPLALGEAIICGLPVIARNCHYGPNDILNPENLSFNGKNYLEAEYGILISNEINDTITKKDIWKKMVFMALEKGLLSEPYRQKLQKRAFDLDLDTFSKNWENVLIST